VWGLWVAVFGLMKSADVLWLNVLFWAFLNRLARDSRASLVSSHVRIYIIEFSSASGTMKKLIVASKQRNILCLQPIEKHVRI